MIRITDQRFDPAAALADFMPEAGGGAVVTFVGVVRETGGVEQLELQHYAGFTEARVGEIVDGIAMRHGLTAITLIHRYGPMKPGEPIMFAATAAPRRRAALTALDELMDRLKTEAPFWKKERRADGDYWLEASDADRRDAARWETKP